MKNAFLFSALTALIFTSCKNSKIKESSINGSWKLIYNEIKEVDSVHIKDLSNIDFIKVINNTHFSFINQPKDTLGSFYAGAGTYTFDGENYIETLQFIEYKAIRNHQFKFKVRISGDTLIQYGREKVEAANMNREITEKYLRIR